MGTTAKGYPYPEGTDLVMDGDDAIQALAEAIDARAFYGTANGTGTVVVNDISDSATVTFPAGKFSVPPVVVATAQSSYYNVSASATTATSVLLTCRHINATTSSSNVRVGWVAVQFGAPSALATGESADVIVTCPTSGCGNQGVPIPIVSTYTDEDGNARTVGYVECGVCGVDISASLQPIEGS